MSVILCLESLRHMLSSINPVCMHIYIIITNITQRHYLTKILSCPNSTLVWFLGNYQECEQKSTVVSVPHLHILLWLLHCKFVRKAHIPFRWTRCWSPVRLHWGLCVSLWMWLAAASQHGTGGRIMCMHSGIMTRGCTEKGLSVGYQSSTESVA